VNAEAANRILPALMGALLLGLAAPAPAALSVKVAEATEVGAPQVTLGRIAELAGGSPALRRQAEGLVVHRFDGDSQRWRVSGRAVSRALWQADIPLKRVELDIPLGARVTWRMEPIDGQRVKQAITEQLRAGAGDGGRLSVAFPQGLPAFDGLPARGRVNVSREAADRVRVRVSVDGQVAASRSVPVRVARERRVVVAAKDLSAGTRLQPGDLERAYRPVSGSRWSHFRRSEEVAGSWVLRQVPAGQPVQRDHLRMQPDVRPGDPVTLVFEGEQLSISAPGKVRQQGAIGEVLAVENRQSGKAVYARLVDGSTAKVVDRKLSQRGGRP
jgi:flagella basal body P-ring formation protein FlgA